MALPRSATSASWHQIAKTPGFSSSPSWCTTFQKTGKNGSLILSSRSEKVHDIAQNVVLRLSLLDVYPGDHERMSWLIQNLFSLTVCRDNERCGLQRESSAFSAISPKKSVKGILLQCPFSPPFSFLKYAIHLKRVFHPPAFHPFQGLFFDSMRK